VQILDGVLVSDDSRAHAEQELFKAKRVFDDTLERIEANFRTEVSFCFVVPFVSRNMPLCHSKPNSVP